MSVNIPEVKLDIVAVSRDCERYNSRFKASGQERLWVRKANSAAKTSYGRRI